LYIYQSEYVFTNTIIAGCHGLWNADDSHSFFVVITGIPLFTSLFIGIMSRRLSKQESQTSLKNKLRVIVPSFLLAMLAECLLIILLWLFIFSKIDLTFS
jgi:hypothetical protein